MASLESFVAAETAATDPAQTPETTEKTSDTAATETKQAETAVTEDATSASETVVADDTATDDDGQFRELVKNDFGLDLSKYQSDYEAVKGLVEASRTIGARNEDAEYGKQVKQLLAGREAELQEWLDSQGKAKETTKSQATSEVLSYEQYQLLAAQAAMGNASAATKQKFADAQASITQRMYEVATKEEAVPEDVIERIAAKIVDQRLGQNNEQSTITQTIEKHKEWLHVDGDLNKPMTPAGEQAFRLYQGELADGVRPARALEKALRQAQLMNPTVKPIRKPVIGGRRTAAVAVPANEPPSLETLFKPKAEGGKGMTLAQVAMMEHEKRKAK